MHSTHSVGHAASGGSENLQAAPPPLQHGQHAGQGGSTGAVPIAALAAPQPDWFDRVLQQAAQPHSDKSALVTITQSSNKRSRCRPKRSSSVGQSRSTNGITRAQRSQQ